jgi:hypothetical protein
LTATAQKIEQAVHGVKDWGTLYPSLLVTLAIVEGAADNAFGVDVGWPGAGV